MAIHFGMNRDHSFFDNSLLKRTKQKLKTLARDPKQSYEYSRFYSLFRLMHAEVYWINQRRPFFNLYPSVAQSLSQSPLKVTPKQIPLSIVHSLGTICVNLPTPSLAGLNGVSHFFIHFLELPDAVAELGGNLDIEDRRQCKATMSVQFTGKFTSKNTQESDVLLMRNIDCRDNETFEFVTSSYPKIPQGHKSFMAPADLKKIEQSIAKLAIGVMLLAADPDYIRPVLLKRDHGKTDIEACVARAKKRGVFGFDIGADQESQVSPHWRRPHFAIRWTGKGGAIPKLVPVKAARIGDTDCLKVPTGFEKP
jgi:hypothetical protein